ncbi:DUF983 domain-containing protein [Gellertiella hungarica]|uniref:Uncharacterized protein (DUF983 family) n=1 Tax=Gellertiella hungarica TaxID=1572859 RepID=A0A7W6NLN6_9HYPH|nr:DUF983 domain-containing protein [Gellertiella hungarica]MBB4066710.1 uncharacterized protein (DUF983 family) [Gellertiella hungarica]
MQAENSIETTRFGGQSESERPVTRSVMRGMLNTCPACGSGKLFRKFLKPVDHCAACNEDMSHQQADDLPPYLVIFIIGHITVGGFMMTDMIFTEWSSWLHLAIWTPITLVSALLLMQPVKGGVIGLQWALRMHGFGGARNEPDHGHDKDYP